MMPQHRPAEPVQMVASPFIDQAQYLTAIPVEPVFTASSTVLSPLQNPSKYEHPSVILRPAQNHFQDHLQRKHEELQKMIAQQQDELRRVSEQLFMARCGILPTTSTYIEPHPPMNLHPGQAPPQMHMQYPVMHPRNPPLQFEMKPTSSELQALDASQNEDIMQFMQNQAQPIQPTNPPLAAQPMQQHDEFEMMPFQMMNQQAQILFSTGNNNDSDNNSSSNK